MRLLYENAMKYRRAGVEDAGKRRRRLRPEVELVFEKHIGNGADMIHGMPLGRVGAEGKDCTSSSGVSIGAFVLVKQVN